MDNAEPNPGLGQGVTQAAQRLTRQGLADSDLSELGTLDHRHASNASTPASCSQPLSAVHALFQPRVAGDDALLILARLRLAQAGLAAEVYADTPNQLEYVLQFTPQHPHPPVAHLSRELNMLHERDRAVVEHFATLFAGRVLGLVVHDNAEMGNQKEAVVEALWRVNARLRQVPDAPPVFLEYAAGLELGWFVEVAQRLKDAELVSCCIDVGHVGVRQACAAFARVHPGIDLRSLDPMDDRLPDLVADVEEAVGSALQDVLEMTRVIGMFEKHVHFHLHDGHPLIAGLPDHFSFLTRLSIPFNYAGRKSLRPLYGPAGLAAIVTAAVNACGLQRLSFTLEIHQVEGRLPLDDAAGLFRHWRDTTNAERTNQWLAVLAQNAMLVESSIPRSLSLGKLTPVSCDRAYARTERPDVGCSDMASIGTTARWLPLLQLRFAYRFGEAWRVLPPGLAWLCTQQTA